MAEVKRPMKSTKFLDVSKSAKLAAPVNAKVPLRTSTPVLLVDPARAELLKCRDRYFKVLQRALKASKGEGDEAHLAAAGFVARFGDLYCQVSEALYFENYRGTLTKLRRKEEAAGDALSPGRVIGEPADEVEDVVARAVRKHGPAIAPKPAAKKAVKAAVKKPATKKER